MMVASSGQSGQSSLVRGAVWDATEVSWRGPKCTTWQNKTLAYTGIIWQEVFVCGPKTKQYFLNKTKDGYARCAVCISPVLREVEGVLWPLKARTHGSILVDNDPTGLPTPTCVPHPRSPPSPPERDYERRRFEFHIRFSVVMVFLFLLHAVASFSLTARVQLGKVADYTRPKCLHARA